MRGEGPFAHQTGAGQGLGERTAELECFFGQWTPENTHLKMSLATGRDLALLLERRAASASSHRASHWWFYTRLGGTHQDAAIRHSGKTPRWRTKQSPGTGCLNADGRAARSAGDRTSLRK